jgi:2,3-bisphosphoglycerate-independent phosphoglycerate mutase
MNPMDMLKNLVLKTDSKIVFLIIDGVGGIRSANRQRTELELAVTPHLDDLARNSICGRSMPVWYGITPGSGPGHLSLFGYDPMDPKNDIGRGVLEALGIDFVLQENDVAARGNFAEVDKKGIVTNRRAGRLPTEKCIALCEKLQTKITKIDGVEIIIRPVRDYRFAVVLRGENLSPSIADTDPQKVGLAPREAQATEDTPSARFTQQVVAKFIKQCFDILKHEKDANAILLRGFSKDPCLPKLPDLYNLTPAAIANYPLYRGVAKLVGMEVLKVEGEIEAEFDLLEKVWAKYDFFFVHVKKSDSYGEDGNVEGKIIVIEQVDELLPRLMSLDPDVVVVTGDHSTPTQIQGHSWHPVPFMLYSKVCDADEIGEFTERACDQGSLGIFPATAIMALALANAGKLKKFGA